MNQLSLLNQPRARHDNPHTSEAAAESVAPASGYLESRIVDACKGARALTAEQIAGILGVREPGRWDEGTIRTAVSRAAKRGLLVVDGTGTTSRGRQAVAFRSAS